jgi:all-trans-nonaprenyl-diphosphate synthase
VLQVIKLISQVIADFANGEISQASALFDTGATQQQYLDKSFFKTASLIAASCRSAAVFSGCDEATKAAMFEYGKHVGLAFQARALLAHPHAWHLLTLQPTQSSLCL